MKPSQFRYVVPHDLDAAISARARWEDSVILSGGQSLVATMNFRLSNPDVVIDLRRLSELDYVRHASDGVVLVGAMARQRTLELDESAYRVNPLLRETVRHIAHPVIRNRGTVGGSLAHADPAAELPCLLSALRGHVVAHGPEGRRTIEARDFFEFIFTTSLQPGELLVEAAFPTLHPGEGYAFCEFTRRHGDFAVAAVAATIRLDGAGKVASTRLGACGISTTPVVLGDSENLLAGETPSREAFAEAAEVATRSVTTADDDDPAGSYRKHVLRGLVSKALNKALEGTEAIK